jgi:hypothetical protein
MAHDKVRLLKECVMMRNSEFMTYLKSEYESAKERLVNAPEEDHRRLQGEARTFQALIRLVEGAQESLADVEKKRERKRERHQQA